METFTKNDWQEFLDGKIAVNCPTEELAKEFVFSERVNKRHNWTEDSHWNSYKEAMAYSIEPASYSSCGVLNYSPFDWYVGKGYVTKQFKGWDEFETCNIDMSFTHVRAKDNFYIHGRAGKDLFLKKDKVYEVRNKDSSGFNIDSEFINGHGFTMSHFDEFFIPIYEKTEIDSKEELKPPLGVMPKYIFEEKRIMDLCRALYEYSQYKIDKDTVQLMTDWNIELCERLNNIER